MSEQTFKECRQLKKLLKAETKVIVDHLAEHKWFNHIADENGGVEDFVEKYGWIMREMYCGFACPDRQKCELAKEFLPQDKDDEPVVAEAKKE